MPLSYAVSSSEHLVRVRATGAVVSDDIPRMSSALAVDEKIRPGMQFLVEAVDVQSDLTFTDLRDAAGTLRQLNERGVREMAIVTDSTHLYALAQVFLVFAPAASVEVRVFRERSEAIRWLRGPFERKAS